jgi:HK97 family phage major capsid protein
MDIPALIEQRNQVHAASQAILDAADGREGGLTAEDHEALKANDAQFKALSATIDALQAQEARGEFLDRVTGRQVPPEAPGTPPATAPQGEPTDIHDRILDDPQLGFRGLGDFAMSVRGAVTGQFDDRLHVIREVGAATGMNQAISADGGFLVPPAYSNKIWDGVSSPAESLLARTDNYTVTGESLTFNANAETSRANGSRWGGVRSYWIAEADQVTASRPKFRQVKIEPHQLAVLIYVTDKLLNNAAVALEQYLTRAATDEINFDVGDALINGVGAGKPVGILQSGCLVSVAKETGQAAATIVYENVSKMYMRMHARSRVRASWFINQDTEDQLRQMTIAVGTGGQPVYLPAGGASGQPYGTIFGRPVVPLEYCATLGTVGDIILADWGAYCSGTRGGVNSAASIHLKFDYLETAFRFVYEVDGQPWLASAITPFKGTSNTLSPFVALATRS